MTKKQPSLRSIQQVARKLFEQVEEQEKFIDSIINPCPKPSALLWLKDPVALSDITESERPKIFPDWVTLLSPDSSPGKLPEHQQGLYYCLDPSSVFAMLPLLNLSESIARPLTVIDLCASPGGKSIFAYRALKPESLFSNETVGNRIPALLSNLKRCGMKGTIVTQADPAYLSATNSCCADIVIVDAPCSGQSLLAKSENALGCFSKPVINANVGRQRRILAEASKLIRNEGYLLYSTCTFSKEENEGNIAWFIKNFPSFSVISSNRCWPSHGLGAGSFNCLLKQCLDNDSNYLQEFDVSLLKHWEVYAGL